MNKTVHKNISIDILKCWAALLITNSHMDMLYVYFAGLATGGALGDALFFFCSGFTLFLGRLGRFDNWYKRRINRIYPSVIGWAVISTFFFRYQSDVKSMILTGGGWFVSSIMVYYVLFYFIRKYFSDKITWVFFTAGLFILIWYIICFENKEINHLYKGDWKMVFSFIFMLQGAVIGMKRVKPQCNLFRDTMAFFLCIILFYGIQYAGTKNPAISYAQIITLIPLMGAVYYLYKLANTNKWEKIYNHKWGRSMITIISGLCLEIYLCQFSLFTDCMNFLFPFNLLLMFLLIVMVAYCVRCVGRWVVQTFREEDYDWHSIVKL